ncbi:MAG: DUF4358 domain-containing protein [Eubacteriales bacterium]
MKFKKSVPIILAALALSAALIGCSGVLLLRQPNDRQFRNCHCKCFPEDIAAKIKESVTLTDMQPLSESDISSMYGIDLNDVTAFAGEIDSTGLRTDEFLIIEAKNNESADRILTKMKARQTQRMNEAKTIIQKDMQLYKESCC